MLSKDFTFIDLFSGIGGFHFAMKKFSSDSQCVFSSEINDKANKLYSLNFGINSNYDITKIDPQRIPNFDVLCAGFPCQPFSKAGFQNGFEDTRGTLFFEIIRIIKSKIESGNKPKILILENVRNLATHDDHKTWSIIRHSLVEIGFNVIEKPLILSPKDFGTPQLRDRAIIVAVDSEIFSDYMDFSISKATKSMTLFSILETETDNLKKTYGISDYERKVLSAWDAFIKNLGVRTIGFPIWSDEFGQFYPIDDLPKWKQNFISKNRELYHNNKSMIDKWKIKYEIDTFIKTHRKFEWQAGNTINSVYEGLIQFRPSGVRVKRPDYAPTLVAMAHIPIIGKYKRYITPREAARLQSLPEDFHFDSVGDDIYRLLGNAVNVDVIYNVFKQFVDFLDKKQITNHQPT
ncbi:MAG: DNA cytosine methyltransferase [Ignavibacteriales bacterium]|nr:MAG: DNA cytosine methyltransferase [Ignavibacteriales bacterium]